MLLTDKLVREGYFVGSSRAEDEVQEERESDQAFLFACVVCCNTREEYSLCL